MYYNIVSRVIPLLLTIRSNEEELDVWNLITLLMCIEYKGFWQQRGRGLPVYTRTRFRLVASSFGIGSSGVYIDFPTAPSLKNTPTSKIYPPFEFA